MCDWVCNNLSDIKKALTTNKSHYMCLVMEIVHNNTGTYMSINGNCTEFGYHATLLLLLITFYFSLPSVFYIFFPAFVSAVTAIVILQY